MAFVPSPTTSRASGKDMGFLSRLEAPTGAKGWPFIPVGGSNRDKRLSGPFVPVGASNRDKRPLSPPLARLAVGPGTKATYYPGPKGWRDKWPGTKAYSVVVTLACLHSEIRFPTLATATYHQLVKELKK